MAADNDDDEQTMWQRVRRPRAGRLPADVEHDRRIMRPTVNLLAYLPLGLVALGGFSAYVRTDAKVEEIERNQRRIEATLVKELDRADESHAAMLRGIWIGRASSAINESLRSL